MGISLSPSFTDFDILGDLNCDPSQPTTNQESHQTFEDVMNEIMRAPLPYKGSKHLNIDDEIYHGSDELHSILEADSMHHEPAQPLSGSGVVYSPEKMPPLVETRNRDHWFRSDKRVLTQVCGVYSPEKVPPSNKPKKGYPFPCPRCAETFTRRDSVKRHFPGCILKHGNPNALKWIDHPSLTGPVDAIRKGATCFRVRKEGEVDTATKSR